MQGFSFGFKPALVFCKNKGALMARSLSRKKIVVSLIVLALCSLPLVAVPWVFTLKMGPVEVTQWNRDKGKATAIVGPGEKTWVPLPRISKHVINAVVVAEDARFFTHHGLDFIEIWRSFLTNLEAQRYARGASTITQQVVKLVYLEPEKTIVRKVREIMGALVLEVIMDKEEILEWYLNLVDFGHGVYGIKKGAAHYFATSPELITIAQGVHLAVVLPSPNRWSKGLRQGNLTPFGHNRFAQILTQMRKAGYITQYQWQQAMATGNFGSPIRNNRRLSHF